MENSRISATILLFFVSIEIGVAEFVIKPSVTEVVVSGSTYLNCSTNSLREIDWFHTPVGSTHVVRRNIFSFNQFFSLYIGRFHMESDEHNGAYNLVIASVQIQDAGLYECEDWTGNKAPAQLIVLVTNPICQPRLDTHEIIGPNKCGIEPNQLILSCTVNYHGSEAPILEWRRASDNNIISVSEGVTHGTIDNNLVVYNLTIKGNSTVKDGDSYICNTTRSTMSNYVCKSGKIKIQGSEPAEVPETSNGNDIFNPYEIAMIICIFLLSTLFLAVFVLSWKLKNRLRSRLPRPYYL